MKKNEYSWLIRSDKYKITHELFVSFKDFLKITKKDAFNYLSFNRIDRRRIECEIIDCMWDPFKCFVFKFFVFGF